MSDCVMSCVLALRLSRHSLHKTGCSSLSILHIRPLSYLRCIPAHSSPQQLKYPQPRQSLRGYTMSQPARDVSHQTNINKMKTENGNFNRAASSFRNFIEKDGQFPPEKGTLYPIISASIVLLNFGTQTDITSTFRMPAVSCFLDLIHEKLFNIHTLIIAWATRTLIMRRLKGLEDIIRMSTYGTSSPYSPHSSPYYFFSCDRGFASNGR